MDQPVQPEVYVPFADDTASPVSFVLRSSADPAELAALVRREVHAVDKDLVPTDIITLRELVSGSLQQERFRTSLLSGFAGAALAARRDWNLRRAGVSSYAAHPRDWHPHGVRRAATTTPRHDIPAGDGTGCLRRSARNRRRRGLCAPDPHAALRRGRNQSGNLCSGRRNTADGGNVRLLFSRAPGHQGRSNGSPSR